MYLKQYLLSNEKKIIELKLEICLKENEIERYSQQVDSEIKEVNLEIVKKEIEVLNLEIKKLNLLSEQLSDNDRRFRKMMEEKAMDSKKSLLHS